MTGTTEHQNYVVATFSQHPTAEKAIRELKDEGFDIKKLSIIGREEHSEHVAGFCNTGERIKYWGKHGAFWGGLFGFLFGVAVLFVPGVGPIVAAGTIVSWIAGALEGAVIGGGLSVLGAALYSVGIPKDSVLKYETSVKEGKFVLIAHGTADEVQKARSVLQAAGADQIDVHRAPTPTTRAA
jgi:hypothetical protein